MLDSVVTLGFVILATFFLIYFGMKRQPGIGIIIVVALVGVAFWQKEISFAQMGLVAPENWLTTLFLGIGLGGVIQLLSVLVFEPLSEKITGEPHDFSAVENVRGNIKALLTWLAVVWVVVAFLEEFLYRGVMMSQIEKLLGTGFVGVLSNLLITSAIFGLSHAYQGKSGTWSTAIIGLLLGIIYIVGANLWLPIFVHGFIDTVGLGMMSFGYDVKIKELVYDK